MNPFHTSPAQVGERIALLLREVSSAEDDDELIRGNLDEAITLLQALRNRLVGAA